MANDDPKLIVGLEARVKDFERQLKRATQTADKQFKTIETRAGALSTKLAGIGKTAFAGFAAGALAALAPAAAFNSVMATLAQGSNMAKAADRVGLTTTAFQELSFGFSLAGVEAAAFEANMEQFTKRIGEAATKGGDLAKIFEANGVALRDSNGQIRSAESLLKDYANLIKNAASAQERMTLATTAFGRGGGDMVTALQGGSEALDDMKRATEEAGGTIDEELLRRAEVLDDQFAAMWRRFDVNAKSAVLTAVTALDDLLAKAQEVGNASIFKRIAEGMAGMGMMYDDITFLDPDLARAAGQPLGPDARVRDAFGASAAGVLDAADTALIEELQKRYGGLAKKAPTTILPGSGDDKPKGRNREMERAAREAEAVLRVIDSLRIERAEMGLSEVEQAKANALRAAGAAATDEQAAEILALVDALYAERDASDAAAEASAELRDIGRDVLGGMIADIRAGTSAAELLENALSRVADRLLDLALDGLFNPGGGGGIGGLFKLFGFAKGGIAAGGRPQPLPTFARGGVSKSAAIFGEAGPEAAVPLPDGRRIPVDLRMPKIAPAAAASAGPVNINVNVEGANGDRHVIALVEQGVTAGIRQYDRGSVGRLSRDAKIAPRRGRV